MKNEKQLEDLINKINLSKKGKLDLSRDEDLSIAIMNLISIEEHFFFTAQKTNKDEYYDLLKDVREIRKDLLKKIIKDYEGEIWCVSKHLLAASMRLMEVGTKSLSQQDKKSAKEFFDKAYQLYNLFWAINLKLINVGDIKKIDPKKISKDEKSASVFDRIGELIKKAIDCCIE
jgi:hypothetical protein